LSQAGYGPERHVNSGTKNLKRLKCHLLDLEVKETTNTSLSNRGYTDSTHLHFLAFRGCFDHVHATGALIMRIVGNQTGHTTDSVLVSE